MNAKENVRDFDLSRPYLDSFQAIVFLLHSERPLHLCRPHPRQFFADDIILFLHEPRTTSLYKRSLYPSFPAVLLVGFTSIACISSDLRRVHSKKPPVYLQAVLQSGFLIESIERQLLDEGESVNQDIVALCSELHSLHFLTSHDRSHIGFADAHYPVFHDLSSHRRIAGSGCKGSLRDIP